MPLVGVCLVDTVDGLTEGYTPRQVANVRAAIQAMTNDHDGTVKLQDFQVHSKRQSDK